MFEIAVNGTDKLPVKLVDSTDRVTEETGITSPTVYYSKAGGAATALSTPTWSQLDATNMPGVYLLTLTTAMTDTAGPLVVTVTKTGCAPASLVCDVKAARVTTADVTNDISRYVHGSVWIDTVNGATGTTSYVNGLPSNPCSTLASAKTVGDNLKLKRFWIQAGSSVSAAADYPGYIFDGRGYVFAVSGTRNFSSAQFENVEGLSGTMTAATGEIVVRNSHLGALTIGEADFIGCHLNGTVTLSQASVPYLFHGCAGVGTLGKVTFAAASQTAVIAKWSGDLTIAGMVAGNALYLDGDGSVTFDNTNTGGTVHISGNLRLTNNGAGLTITDTSRYGEDQNVAAVTGAVGSVTAGVTVTTNNDKTGYSGTATNMVDISGLATETNATSNKNAVIAAIPAAGPTLAQIEASTVLAKEAAATSNKNAVIAAMPSTAGLATSAELAAAVTDIEGHITTSSAPSASAIALAVESQLADDFAGVSTRGAGSSACTLDLTPIASGAEVWLTSDLAGTQVYAGTLVADAQGHVTFLLDAGTTYYRWATKPGVRFTNPQAFVAVAD